jgi:hypothetical protein
VRTGSERRVLARIVAVIAGGVLLKLLEDRLYLAAVTGPDRLAKVVEQIEHSERLLGGPDRGYVGGDRPQMRWYR